MNIARRQFFKGIIVIAASPAAVAVAKALPVLEPVRSHWANQRISLNAITREAIRLFQNSNSFIADINRQFDEYNGWPPEPYNFDNDVIDDKFDPEMFNHSATYINPELRIRLPLDYTEKETVQ